MGDGEWPAGVSEPIIRAWMQDGVLVSSGSAYYNVIRANGGQIEYLQGGLTTWSTTPYNFSLAFNVTLGWWAQFTPPEALIGQRISVIGVHSSQPEVLSESALIVAASAANPSTHKEVKFVP